MLHTKYVHLCQ